MSKIEEAFTEVVSYDEDTAKKYFKLGWIACEKEHNTTTEKRTRRYARNVINWYDYLPKTFKRREAIDLGKDFGVNQKSIDITWLPKDELFTRIANGEYEKVKDKLV